jgi:predicted PurR-regulated permease PerM
MDLTRALFLVVIVVLLAISVAFVLPFLDFFLLTVVLAYLLLPIQKRLEKRVSPAVAAASIVALASVTIVLPLVYVVRRTASDAVALVSGVRDGEITFAGVESTIRETTGVEIDLSDILQRALSNVDFDNLLNVFGAVTHLLIGLGLTLFLLYYFLRDRDSFLRWLRRQTPLSDDVQDDLFKELDHIMKAVLVGHVFVAFVQGLLAGLGLVATGVPNAMFWTVVMTVLSLLPVVGSFLVWGPASAYLFVSGEPVLAIGLALWGTIVVGISDDYLRPIVIDRYAKVNPSVIIIGVLGGIYVIGFMGIFFGPVVIGMLRATIEAFVDEFEAERTT